MGPPNIKLFNLLSYTHEIFKVSKYKGKIKFDKIWGCQNGGPPQTGPHKFKLFIHLRSTHDIFRLDEYEKKVSPNGALQNSNFLAF